jgi:hypothetical protein
LERKSPTAYLCDAVNNAQGLIGSESKIRSLTILKQATDDSQDLRRREGKVEGLRGSTPAGEHVEEGRVTGFDGEDSDCRREYGVLGNHGCGTHVSTHSGGFYGPC